MKTKIQIRAEGLGVRQKSIYAGYNPLAIQNQLYEAGYGTKCLWTGYHIQFPPKIFNLESKPVISQGSGVYSSEI
jgi:hypothetical protein